MLQIVFELWYVAGLWARLEFVSMTKTTAILVLISACLSGCGQTETEFNKPLDMAAEAQRIALSSIIVDTHIDVPYRLNLKDADISMATDSGDFDYPRAVSGGLNAPFMSIYTPAELEAAGGSKALADSLIDMVEGFVAKSPDKFAVAFSVADVREQFAKGLISFPLGMENGSPIEGDIANVEHFYHRGVRYITLAHSKPNHLSDSSYDKDRPSGGLTEFGVEVVREMNRLGIMVDISHVSDDAFWKVMEVSDVPVIASHSSARFFTPEWERNMNDEMIQALAKNGGVIQINFGSSFLTAEAQIYGVARMAAGLAYKAEHPEMSIAELMHEYPAIYAVENGSFPYASIDDAIDHIDHVVKLTSVDHVGIGSDFDGVGDSLPVGLKDVSSYPNLVKGLLERGYSEEDIRKILGENLLRVWAVVEAHASKQ